MQTINIAITLASHNRRELTLSCLSRIAQLDRAIWGDRIQTSVVLLDDNSTDGTKEAVARQFPTTTLLAGTGDLYWNGGMRRALDVALRQYPDYVLLLNDDVLLAVDSLVRLTDACRRIESRDGKAPAIVGATEDAPSSSVTSYGGLRRRHAFGLLSFERVDPNDRLQSIDTFNGNCVLIPARPLQEIGHLDPQYIHTIGDMDLGLRLAEHGVPILLLPGYVGSCKKNPQSKPWLQDGKRLMERIAQISSPKGLPPKQYAQFCRRHAGWRWPFAFTYPYVAMLVRHIATQQLYDKLRGRS